MMLKDIFRDFAKHKVLIIGDVMVDSYLIGKVDRISPEAPVPIVSVQKRENRLGGAANVALNIKALGAEPILCTVVGKDEKGKIYQELLKQNSMSDSGLLFAENRKTTSKTRIMSGTQHTLRVDDEITSPISANLEKKLIERVYAILEIENINAIIFEDYDKGVLTPQVISAITKHAKRKGIPVLVDPKKRNFLEYRGATLFKPNFKEFCEGAKLELSKSNFRKIIEHAKNFQLQYDIDYMFITLSEMGVVITSKTESHHIAAQIRHISDVSGAGDTVISTAALCLIAGLKPFDIARIANTAGGLVCEFSGVVPINKNRLLKEVAL